MKLFGLNNFEQRLEKIYVSNTANFIKKRELPFIMDLMDHWKCRIHGGSSRNRFECTRKKQNTTSILQNFANAYNLRANLFDISKHSPITIKTKLNNYYKELRQQP